MSTKRCDEVATEKVATVDVARKEDPQQTQYWTPPESRMMEGWQTEEEQLPTLLHATANPSTVKKGELILARSSTLKNQFVNCVCTDSYQDSDLLELLVDYGLTSLD